MAIFSTIGSIISGIGSAVSGAASAVGSAVSGIASGTGMSAAQAITAATGLIGTGISAVGAMQQAEAARDAERLRQTQMTLEAQRSRREVVRRAIAARAVVANQAGAQGLGQSSGALGGQSQAVAQGASNVQAINQGEQLGNRMFDINRRYSSGQTLASIGGTIQDIGTTFAKNSDVFSRVWGTPA